ncbi:MAG: hypothetical protein ACEQSL_00675 [Sediminibacterium sp.]
MTTREAFKKLITTPAISNVLGIHRGDVGKMKKEMLQTPAKYPTEERMNALLTKAGYKVKQEKMWEEKK